MDIINTISSGLSSLARIAAALELIADTVVRRADNEGKVRAVLGAGAGMAPGDIADCRETGKPDEKGPAHIVGITAAEEMAPIVPADQIPSDRDDIKAALDKLGADYNSRAATKTLAAKLESCIEKQLKSQEPVAQVQAPVVQVQAPDAQVQAPDAQVQAPVVQVQEPVAKVQEPVGAVDLPGLTKPAPVAVVELPVSVPSDSNPDTSVVVPPEMQVPPASELTVDIIRESVKELIDAFKDAQPGGIPIAMQRIKGILAHYKRGSVNELDKTQYEGFHNTIRSEIQQCKLRAGKGSVL